MLNISDNRIDKFVDMSKYTSAKIFADNKHYRVIRKVVWGVAIVILLVLFLPWTQNIKGSGYVTTLRPEQRPQTVHAIIGGRIEKWYVQEGDYVHKGDTIMFLSETKESYFDPDLIANTGDQVRAKEGAVESYTQKVSALTDQIKAIERERELKLKQAQNKLKQSKLKVISDSIDLEAVKIRLNIAETQYDRAFNLNKEGLKPMTYVEEKKVKLQEMQAKIITQENKYLTSQNELINAEMELTRLNAAYAEKLAKAQSDIQTALSTRFDTQSQVSKLRSQYAGYLIRNGMYYITAPQDGYVNRALQSGIGETIKEGTSVVSIMPASFDIAVETYIEPLDYPLVHKGGKVRIWFDGWPTIVFSGWPGVSYGTFGGVVVAKENFISANGKYRVLIAPDPEEKSWPAELSVGAGSQTLALLDDVPIWFEIWRTLNGFPPNFYTTPGSEGSTNEKKK
ncbi:HlyD family efflux transporter periplasmic adaptor subunit [Sinomicrobium pectinilyticum]|uniref:HlyD family efflux transporter periplasmic adaptor subunit n=1 Tax=Sinomicrobium pectinilyticum TaxID=1084421 RepID=A0A3N0DYQ1_SINP1|nr:biotin/lipoyl-binding protein [Sinomicrobium pectinilyticum]RNL80740.1 HlyD family efflux transporter periplasmic adaptor subunit [Sinomicrobium pectinilyticum]